MAHIHNGLNKQTLGRIHSDEQFTVRIKHVMKLKSEGIPVSWFKDKFNRVRVKRNNVWWVLDEIAEHEPMYDWRK